VRVGETARLTCCMRVRKRGGILSIPANSKEKPQSCSQPQAEYAGHVHAACQAALTEDIEWEVVCLLFGLLNHVLDYPTHGLARPGQGVGEGFNVGLSTKKSTGGTSERSWQYRRWHVHGGNTGIKAA
jgi:hypothetical protein